MVKKNYREGDWFAVPLDPRGFAVGLAARNTPRGSGILAYFFGTKYDTIPHLSDLKSYTAADALTILQIGDLGIINGEWQVIGHLPNWDRSQWPMPDFVRREPISNRIWRITYSNDDPDLALYKELISEEEAKGLEPDVLSGYKAAEKKLSKALKKS